MGSQDPLFRPEPRMTVPGITGEPVSSLDAPIQAQVINMFDELQDKLGLTYTDIYMLSGSVDGFLSNPLGCKYFMRRV